MDIDKLGDDAPQFRINIHQTAITTLRMLCFTKQQNEMIIGLLIGIKNDFQDSDSEKITQRITDELNDYNRLLNERATQEFNELLPDILD